ncbi:IS3 family transposase [Geodermatophilus sp. URMC 65]
MTRFAFIDQEKAHHDVAALCRLLQVSRSCFYAWLSRPPSPRALADEVLTVQIRTAFDDNRRVYGAPRIHAELADAGVRVGRKRVARLMRAAGIIGCHRRKWSFSIPRAGPQAAPAPDRVDRHFVATAPNQHRATWPSLTNGGRSSGVRSGHSLTSAMPLPLRSEPGPKHSSTVAVPSEQRTSRSEET